MKVRIKHTRRRTIRKSISIPEDTFRVAANHAARFPDFSKYVQDLIIRDGRGRLIPKSAA